MKARAISRRSLLEKGACVLAAAAAMPPVASARATTGLRPAIGKVAAVRCYFGGQNSYPAGVISGHG